VTLPGFPVHTGGAITEPPALGDLNGDGYKDIVVFAGNRIIALNKSGAALDNFPVTAIAQTFSSSPVIADVNNDGAVDVVGGTSGGLVVAYGADGRSVPGFPLQTGTGLLSIAVVGREVTPGSVQTILVAGSSDDGVVAAWQIGGLSAHQPVLSWSQYQHDPQHTGLDLRPVTGPPVSPAFFPPDRAYNWPNPVYDGRTFIRYFVREDATVRIKIFDLAGDLVTELTGQGSGGVDNEIEWNVGDVQSGVYFARIEATGTGSSGVAVIKVAVVK
jgi:hypothetical protein